MRIVFTGGHHSSALPVISRLKKEKIDSELFWIGHKKSQKGNKANTLEYIEISKLEIPFFDLKAGKFYKANSLSHYLKLPYGFIQSLYFLLRIKPDVIMSFGGYLAAPVVVSGWILGIPSISHEQTVVAGYANKLISRFAQRILVSWKESEKFFPPDKVRYSGLPLRESIFEIRSNKFNVDNGLPYIFILGGKTGSHLINTLVEDSLESLLSFSNLIHVLGDHTKLKDYERISEKYEAISKKVFGAYFPYKFIDDEEIGEAYNKSDLVISRAGAHTVSEIIELGKKSVLIPIPWVSHNEQLLNAKMVESEGRAVILEEDDLNKGEFIDAVKHMLNSKVEEIKKKDKEFLPEEVIVDEIIKIAKKEEKKAYN